MNYLQVVQVIVHTQLLEVVPIQNWAMCLTSPTVFVRLVQCGSLTATAQKQGVTPSAVSRRLGIRRHNRTTRSLAERDPSQVEMLKAALGASLTTALAWFNSEPLPTWMAALGLLAVGATGYGLSLRLYLLAQRAFGAARTSSVFAFAPFIGAAFAFLLGDRSAGGLMMLGELLMLSGVALHLAEDHGHAHVHEPLDPEHSHLHHHEKVQHSHAHVPDSHHQHVH
jgi:hypothetical protein